MNKIKNFLIKYEVKFVLVFGFILVAFLSFQFGYMKGKKNETKAIVIEKTTEVTKTEPQGASSAITGATSLGLPQNITEAKNLAPACAYVGSKTSNKVHLPTCRYAKTIKPENLVCFSSLDDALKQGRLVDKSCIK